MFSSPVWQLCPKFNVQWKKRDSAFRRRKNWAVEWEWMALHGYSAKSQVHAQPMEMTIRIAIWRVPFLLSAHWVPKKNKFPSVLSLCSGKVLTSNSLWPRSRSLCWALPSLQGVTEPIFTLLPLLHLQNYSVTILHLLINGVKLLWIKCHVRC